jgi:hypothetical protein
MAAAAERSDRPVCDNDDDDDDDDDDDGGGTEEEEEEEEEMNEEESVLTGADCANGNNVGTAEGCSNGFTSGGVATAAALELCHAAT